MSEGTPLDRLDIGVLAGVAGAAGAALAGLTFAALHPHATLFGPTLWSGPRLRRAVALTFDDGPHPRFTPRVAELLARHKARATFFCVGREVDRHRSLARELFGAGHQFANHTYRHGLGADLFFERRLTGDLRRCQEALAEVTGHAPRYYRPAVGVRNPAVHAAARTLGLAVVTWTRAARDGARRLTEPRARALGRAAQPGDILALHDGVISVPEAVREGTVEHLPALLDELEERGLALVTLDELLQR